MKQQTQTNKIEWREFELEDIGFLLTGFAFNSNFFNRDKNGIPLIRIRDISKGDTETYYSGEYSKEYLVKRGDFLIGMDGEFNIFEWKGKESLLNQRVCKLVLNKNKVYPKYIFYIIQKKLKEIENKTPFVTVKHISSKKILSIKFNLPDIEEQERIVGILEKVETLKQKGKKAGDLLDEYLKSIFYEMFGDKKKFETKRLSDICSGITKGTTPTTYGHPFANKGINFLKIENIEEDGTILLNSLKFISKETHDLLKRSQLNEGDLIFSIAGALGRVAVIKKEHLPANINQALAMVRIRSDKEINRKYLEYYLRSEAVTAQVKENKRGVAQPNLNLEQIRNLKIISPPLLLQQKFAKIIEYVEGLKENVKKTKQNSEELFNSLMQKAFRGEL